MERAAPEMAWGRRVVHEGGEVEIMDSTVIADEVAQGESFEQFMNSLRDPAYAAPIVSARRFSEALHIDMQTLAKQAGVHRNTLSRTPASESVQRFLREALRVIRAATDANGCVKHALFWYRNEPLSAFEYKTAEQLVSSGRTEEVLRYVVSHDMSSPAQAGAGEGLLRRVG
jgi:DNA-binding phage protein